MVFFCTMKCAPLQLNIHYYRWKQLHSNPVMGPQESSKSMEWKPLDSTNGSDGSSIPILKKRLRKKVRQVPDDYFLPRRSLPAAIALYGAICAAGVGAGMLVEVWINKKIKEDGGILWAKAEDKS